MSTLVHSMSTIVKVRSGRPSLVLRRRCSINRYFAFSTLDGVTCPECIRLNAFDLHIVKKNLFGSLGWPNQLTESAGPSTSPSFELRPSEPLQWAGRDVYVGAIGFATSILLSGIRQRLYRAFRDGHHSDFMLELECLVDVKLTNREKLIPHEYGHELHAIFSGDISDD